MNAPMLFSDGDAMLDIAVTRGADGASRLVRRRVSYPWSLGRGYPCDDGTVRVIPQAAGAGLLSNDCFRQQITVTSGASLRIDTAGATLVHGASPSQAGRSSWRYILEGSAKASIASEPYVLMEDSELVLRQDLVIDVNAVLVATETVVLAPGVTRASWKLETTASRPDGTQVFKDVQIATSCSLSRTGCLPKAFNAFSTVLIFYAAALLEGHALADVDQDPRLEPVVLLVLTQQVAVAAGVGLPVDAVHRIAGGVGPVAGELHRRAAGARAVATLGRAQDLTPQRIADDSVSWHRRAAAAFS